MEMNTKSLEKERRVKKIQTLKIQNTTAQSGVPPLEDVCLLMKSDGEESALDKEVTSRNIPASRANKVVQANRPVEMT
eukprot:5651665-Ditylum_brightwellii.AAC.1